MIVIICKYVRILGGVCFLDWEEIYRKVKLANDGRGGAGSNF
jgi:hypothetical protein